LYLRLRYALPSRGEGLNEGYFGNYYLLIITIKVTLVKERGGKLRG
jgi:hypothetical protein